MSVSAPLHWGFYEVPCKMSELTTVLNTVLAVTIELPVPVVATHLDTPSLPSKYATWLAMSQVHPPGHAVLSITVMISRLLHLQFLPTSG